MSTHTPGPWCVDINKSTGTWSYRIRQRRGFGKGREIATVNPYVNPARDGGATIEGNAALLAAAPKMLEALDHARGLILWALDNGADPESTAAVHNMVCQAITAATSTPVDGGSEWDPDSHWDEHPDYPAEDWKYEVEHDDTRQGYIAWVNSQIEQDQEE